MKKVPKELPVLFLAGKEDPVGDFGKGVKMAYQSFLDHDMTDVSYKLYEGARHEIIREKQKDAVNKEILSFVQRITENFIL